MVDEKLALWRPIESAPRGTEIFIAHFDGTKWHMDSGWVEDWEPEYSAENMRWQPLPSPPEILEKKERAKSLNA